MNLLAAFLLFLPAPACDQPTLTGVCQYGSVTQCGHRLTITGDNWLGIGEIRGNVVRITWTQLSGYGDGRAVMAYYTVEGRTLSGVWGYADAVEDAGGWLTGCVMGETIVVRD